jgi:phosphoglycerate dehydrogenase-like enzyme
MTEQLTYLCTLDLPDAWFDGLSAAEPDLEIVRAAAVDELGAGLRERVAFLHTGGSTIGPDELPGLRAVQLDTSGVDHLAGTALWASELPIATLGGIAPVPMAEFATMSVLGLAHHLPELVALRASRTWLDPVTRLRTLTPAPVRGTTMCIVGYGRIGREISRQARALGMDVIGVSRSGRPTAAGDRFGSVHGDQDPTELVRIDALHDALGRADWVVLVLPRTPETAGLFDAAAYDAMRPGARFVNIARGGIADEAELLARLRDGRIAGAALDVFDDEPLGDDSPWWTEPNTIVTTHVAGLSPDYGVQTLDLTIENIRRLRAGRPLLNEVNRAHGY